MIEQLFAGIIEREGGYVDNAVDRGGPTNMGITLSTLSSYLGRPATVDEVKALSSEQAADIYKALFYHMPRFDRLPPDLQPPVVDAGVMSGPSHAVRMLQQVASLAGRSINIDGMLGEQSLMSIQIAVNAQGVRQIIRDFTTRRIAFYRDIVARDPRQAEFLAGWISRANSFLNQNNV